VGKTVKHVTLSELEEQTNFVKKAASYFSKNPKKTNYTAGDIVAGCLFALRWGMDENSVLIFKLDENHEPMIFGQAVQEAQQ